MTTSRRSAASSISARFATSSRSRRTCTSQLPRHACLLHNRRSAVTSGRLERRLGSPVVRADHAPVALTPEGERLFGTRARAARGCMTGCGGSCMRPTLGPDRRRPAQRGTAHRCAHPEYRPRDGSRARVPRPLRRRSRTGARAAAERRDRRGPGADSHWLDQPPVDDIGPPAIRLEPLAVLLPAGHPLAERSL